MKILILCTGNSCRSQMAEAFLGSFDAGLEVVSAGTSPSQRVHPKAVLVMKEEGIDIERNKPTHVKTYLNDGFDYVITVCGGAKESCPVFSGTVKQRLHIGFDDPAEVRGSEEFIMSEFRRIRNEIKKELYTFYVEHIQSKYEWKRKKDSHS